MESCMNSDIEIKLCGDENDFKNLITRWNDLFKEYAGKKGDVKNYRVKPSSPKDIIISKCRNKKISYERATSGFSFEDGDVKLDIGRNFFFVVSPDCKNNCVHEDEKNKTSITSYKICCEKKLNDSSAEKLEFFFSRIDDKKIVGTTLLLKQRNSKKRIEVLIVAKNTKDYLMWDNFARKETLDNIFGLEVILNKFDYQEVFQNLQCFYNEYKSK